MGRRRKKNTTHQSEKVEGEETYEAHVPHQLARDNVVELEEDLLFLGNLSDGGDVDGENLIRFLRLAHQFHVANRLLQEQHRPIEHERAELVGVVVEQARSQLLALRVGLVAALL